MTNDSRFLKVGDRVMVRSAKYPDLQPWAARITARNVAIAGAYNPYYKVDNGIDGWVWHEQLTAVVEPAPTDERCRNLILCKARHCGCGAA